MRRRHDAFRGSLTWTDGPPSTVAFTREAGGARLACVVNFGDEPVPLPAGRLVLASERLDENGAGPGPLPGNTAAWVDLG